MPKPAAAQSDPHVIRSAWLCGLLCGQTAPSGPTTSAASSITSDPMAEPISPFARIRSSPSPCPSHPCRAPNRYASCRCSATTCSLRWASAPLFRLPEAFSPSREAETGPPGLPHFPCVIHAVVSDPGEAHAAGHMQLHPCWLPPFEQRRPSRVITISGLNPFSLAAYGLHACGPTLKVGDCSLPSKDSLPGGWPALPGRGSHPLERATLPGRTQMLCMEVQAASAWPSCSVWASARTPSRNSTPRITSFK